MEYGRYDIEIDHEVLDTGPVQVTIYKDRWWIPRGASETRQGYFASEPFLGCGATYSTPKLALDGLLRDHGFRIAKMKNFKVI